jgi:hypothetical protein
MDFGAGVYLSEAQNLIPPAPYILYTCIQYIHIYTGKGVEINRREG